MNSLVMLIPILTPLAIIALRNHRSASWLIVLAALPAFLVAVIQPVPEIINLEWLLLGVHLGLDETGRHFMLASALVWLVSATYAAGIPDETFHFTRFRTFFLLAMSGNFTLILAQDMTSFYLGFTLMGLSAYGLVAHRASVTARRAGRRYMIWTIFGEVLLFSGIVILAGQAGSTDFASLGEISPAPLAVALLVLGFGIKLALPGLHLWLPGSYAAAPVVGTAVLSGPMISTGLLGWLRFLPPGQTSLTPWGEALILIGLLGVILGIGIGLLQNTPRLVLAYSSISKMGLLSSGFGIALAYPATTPLLVPALVWYTLNHLLVKSALFLGTDLVERGHRKVWLLSGLVLLAFSLVGAPFTGGALAKARLISALPEQSDWFVGWLTVATVASTLLMGRFTYLTFTRGGHRAAATKPAWSAWFLLVGVILFVPFILTNPQELFTGGMSVVIGLLFVCLIWVYQPELLSRLAARRHAGFIMHPTLFLRKRVRSLSAGHPLDFARMAVFNPDAQKSDLFSGLTQAITSRLSKLKDIGNLAGTLWLFVASLILFSLLVDY